jgi:hypothetical protein
MKLTLSGFISAASLLFALSAKAQVHPGVHALTLTTDLPFATPKNEMANYYSIGDAMKLYLDASISLVRIQYGKNSPVNFDASVFLGHEKANFDPADYVSNGLNARLTSYGFRLKPLYISKKGNFLASLLSGLFIEIGKSKARLIESDVPDVMRHPNVLGYGLTPAIPFSEKTSFIFEFAFRNYNWINNSNTTSTIHTFRTGLGLQFNF